MDRAIGEHLDRLALQMIEPGDRVRGRAGEGRAAVDEKGIFLVGIVLEITFQKFDVFYRSSINHPFDDHPELITLARVGRRTARYGRDRNHLTEAGAVVAADLMTRPADDFLLPVVDEPGHLAVRLPLPCRPPWPGLPSHLGNARLQDRLIQDIHIDRRKAVGVEIEQQLVQPAPVALDEQNAFVDCDRRHISGTLPIQPLGLDVRRRDWLIEIARSDAPNVLAAAQHQLGARDHPAEEGRVLAVDGSVNWVIVRRVGPLQEVVELPRLG